MQRLRSIGYFCLGLALALAAVVTARAVDNPAAHNQMAVVSISDVWSELAPCG
jgi:hypothetical protein